jgi:hypothetical protein
MGRRTQTPQDPPDRDQSTDRGSGQGPRPAPTTQKGAVLNIGPLLPLTLRHFWPTLNDRLDQIHDPRPQASTTYASRFLLWWGLSLFLFKLGSRRQLDYELARSGPEVLANLNRLAGTSQTSLPVNKTLNDHLGQIGSQPVAELRTWMVRGLLRQKVLDEARLQGYRLVLLDATGHLRFHQRHCPHCLVRQHGSCTLYLHQVLEAKLLGPAGVVISVGTAFIENPDLPPDVSAEEFKQDCELKAWKRLAPELKRDFPQLPICISGDGLYLCGAALAECKANDWRFLVVFKPKRLPSVWEDVQQLLAASPHQKEEVELPNPKGKGKGTRQVYRWVNGVSYKDSDGRTWTFNVIVCEETKADGKKTIWAWATDLAVNRKTVVEIGQRGGRKRWCIENEGFNVQKNSELRLEHAYSHGEEQLKGFYYLLQIAHLILQLVEKGGLLRQLAAEVGKTPLKLFGSLKNMGRRLLESVRNLAWPEEAFSTTAAKRIQIRLDSG